MSDFPFPIPESLASYVKQFETDPEKATRKLSKHLKRRGHDAIGHFFLAFFYFKRGMQNEAEEHALKAKTFAPGSPLMEFLPYYLKHPDGLEAWIPTLDISSYSPYSTEDQISKVSSSLLDLDRLIAELSQVETTRIQPKENSSASGDDLSKSATEVDDIVSETLANIHEQQGKFRVAMETYEKLMKKYPKREKYFKEQIERLRAKSEEGEDQKSPSIEDMDKKGE